MMMMMMMMMMIMMMMHRLRLSSTNFSGFILEYFVPYIDSIPKSNLFKKQSSIGVL